MEVPKTTKTRCRGGSMQTIQDLQRLHMQVAPSYIFFTPSCYAWYVCCGAVTILVVTTWCNTGRCMEGATGGILPVCPILLAHCPSYIQFLWIFGTATLSKLKKSLIVVKAQAYHLCCIYIYIYIYTDR